MSSEDQERRCHPRHQRLGIVNYSGQQGVRCNSIVDIGLGGVRLVLSDWEPPGSRVRLRIALRPEQDPLEVEGLVVWARRSAPYEVGIRFLDVDAGLLEAQL